jgi:5'-3' exonuclease
LLLVDGSNLLHRCLTASQSILELKTSDGLHCTGGLHTFIQSLEKLVRSYRYRAGVIVCWDNGASERRLGIYPDYKNRDIASQQRAEMLNDIAKKKAEEHWSEVYVWSRKELHSNILPSIGCLSLMCRNIEADDIISYCARHIKSTEKIIISTDSDFLQLVSEDLQTTVYDPIKNRIWDKQETITANNLLPGA